MKISGAGLTILLVFHSYWNIFCNAFPYVYPRMSIEATQDPDAGKPLFITPFLKNNSIDMAQKLSRVSITELLRLRSHAGFFTVDSKYNSNLYFWYFAPMSKRQTAPVILWLQGGPGGSSLFGLFEELGPLQATKSGLKHRKHNWAVDAHLIFIDNPVGTGFSFTENDNGYCNDEECVGKNLLEAIDQFFTLFPMLRSNDFYITGESYAGKYIPSLAMQIHKNPERKINLKGLAMGNAYCDPINQLDYGTYLYQHGLIDDNQLKIFENVQNNISTAIKAENWSEADILMDKLLDGAIGNFSYFKLFTGFNNYYDYLHVNDTVDTTALEGLLSNVEVRKSVHVGGLPFNSGSNVQMHLAYDILKSVAPYVSSLLGNYRVLIYNGQLDIIVAYPLTENFLKNLDFDSAGEYKIAKRKIWHVNSEIAGYYKKAGNLTEVLVRNAGHMVPHDQPRWAFDMITKFINKRFV